MEKIVQILMKTLGLSKLVLLIWNAVYKYAKKKVQETENELDNDILEILNTIITALCGELASKK